MEVAGVALAVPPLLLLCLDVLDRVENFRKHKTHQSQLNARFSVAKARLQKWSHAIGVSRDNLDDTHHQFLDDPTVGPALCEVLSVLYRTFDDYTNVSQQLVQDSLDVDQVPTGWNSGQRTRSNFKKLRDSVRTKGTALSWALKGKAVFIEQVEMFESLVDGLYDLLPLDQVTTHTATAGDDPISMPNSRLEMMRIKELLHDTNFRLEYLYRNAMSDMYKRLDEWLKTRPDVDQELEKHSSLRVTETCDWILTNEAYQEWQVDEPLDRRAKLLWIYGPPGFGKTVLCAALISQMKQTSDRPVAYFFSSPHVQSDDNPSSIIRSWISQLVRTDSVVSNMVGEAMMRDDATPYATQTTVWNLFCKILSTIDRCTLFLDGYDEFPRIDDDRQHFLQKLKQAILFTSTRVVVTSRPEDDIELEIASSNSFKDLLISECQITPQHVQEDVRLFAAKVVAERLPKKDESLREILATKLGQKCVGQFLWIKLLKPQIRPGKSKKQLLDIVDQTPPGLSETYRRHWNDIQAKAPSDRKRAIAILRWTCFANRPLTIEELTEALAHEPDIEGSCEDNMPDEIESDYVDSEIKGFCPAFIEISRSPDDLAGRMIQISHPSAGEFLRFALSDALVSVSDSRQVSRDAEHHIHLAEVCVRYIVCDQTWKSYSTDGSDCQDRFRRGFMSYADDGWHDHKIQAGNAISEEYRRLTTRLFDPDGAIFRHWTNNPRYYSKSMKWIKPRCETGVNAAVYLAAFWGLSHILEQFHACKRLDLSPVSFTAGDALSAAAPHGTKIFQTLLSWGADPHLKCGEAGSPLGAAVVAGNVDMILALLKLGADLEAPDPQGRSVLTLACQTNNTDMIQRLLDHGSDPSGQLRVSRSPLFYAISNNNIAATKLLLDYGARLLTTDEDDCSHLHYACMYDCPEIVKLLIKKGSDLESQDLSHRTPLYIACTSGFTENVRCLLDGGAEINTQEYTGYPPLHIASEEGHVEVVRLLIDRGARVNSLTKDGFTPLQYACIGGHAEIVRLLLNEGADADSGAGAGLTPLYFASFGGNTEVVHILLHSGADVNHQDDDGWTPLHRASFEGDIKVVCTLLKGGADIDRQDHSGLTPLHGACYNGNTEVVRMLLHSGANVNHQDDDGWTLLHCACLGGDTEVVSILLDGGADIDRPGCYNQVPLHVAATKSLEITQLLLDRGAGVVMQTGPELLSFQPLHDAVSVGRSDIVQLLLARGAPVNAQTRWGVTALQIAIRRKNIDVIEDLVNAGADLNLVTKGGQTLLEQISKRFCRDERAERWKSMATSHISDATRIIQTRERICVLAHDLLNYVGCMRPPNLFNSLGIEFQYLRATQDAIFALNQELVVKNTKGIIQHLSVYCDGCANPGDKLTGDRWICPICPNQDYCSTCKTKLLNSDDVHSRGHSGHKMVPIQGVCDAKFTERVGHYYGERAKDPVVRAWLEDVLRRYSAGAETST